MVRSRKMRDSSSDSKVVVCLRSAVGTCCARSRGCATASDDSLSIFRLSAASGKARENQLRMTKSEPEATNTQAAMKSQSFRVRRSRMIPLASVYPERVWEVSGSEGSMRDARTEGVSRPSGAILCAKDEMLNIEWRVSNVELRLRPPSTHAKARIA